MTISMKIVIAASVAVIPLGAIAHYGLEAAQARTRRDREWAKARQREQDAFAAAIQRQKAERERIKALAAEAKRLVSHDSSTSDHKLARIKGRVLVWDTLADTQGLADGYLPAELRLSGAESPITVLLVLAKHETLARTYRMVRTETRYEYRDPTRRRPDPPVGMPGRVRLGNGQTDIWDTPGLSQIPVVPRTRQIDTGQVISGFRVDLDVGVVYLPEKKFVGIFRVTGGEPAANISRNSNDTRPEYGDTVRPLAQWITNRERVRGLRPELLDP
jgi:hypothetical protein